MISDARGRHVSPGIYTEEKDVTYSVKSLGITSLGLAGETLYGPAFEPIDIAEWSDFVDYFGGTDASLFDNGTPKYELPYIAKSYLEKSKRLSVVRVLGLSGYDAGPAWVMYTVDDNDNKRPVLILRSKMDYGNGSSGVCQTSNDKPTPLIDDILTCDYKKSYGKALCDDYESVSALTTDYKFGIKVYSSGKLFATYYVSLDKNDDDYIYNILSSDPNKSDYIYIDSVYDIVSGSTIDYTGIRSTSTDGFHRFSGETQDIYFKMKVDNPLRNIYDIVEKWDVTSGDTLISSGSRDITDRMLYGTARSCVDETILNNLGYTAHTVSDEVLNTETSYTYTVKTKKSVECGCKLDSMTFEAPSDEHIYDLDNENYHFYLGNSNVQEYDICKVNKVGKYKFVIRNECDDYISSLTTNDYLWIKGTCDLFTGDYQKHFTYARTPWIVSEASINSDNNTVNVNKLFRFITISDGDVSNYQVKVSFEKLDPVNGTFDVVVRDFNDSDNNPYVLERFVKCSLNRGDSSYIGLKIGTADGQFIPKSKYIVVDFGEENIGKNLSGHIPCGFLGYEVCNYIPSEDIGNSDKYKPSYVKYYTEYEPTRRSRGQYFGMKVGMFNPDILKFHGQNDIYTIITDGFHMDSNLSGHGVYVDGESGYTFQVVSNEKVTTDNIAPTITSAKYQKDDKVNDLMNDTIYKDMNLRKFTVCFFGGFDGWDINRNERTNTDKYNASNYNYSGSSIFDLASNYDFLNEQLNLPDTAITSDYYAYLAGYKCFANPDDIDINLFATPGINWFDNKLLTSDAIEVIEDKEDGRGGDALYVMNCPKDRTVDQLVDEFNDTDIDTSYACTYYPWIVYYDSTQYQYVNLPATKDVVRNMADTDNISFPWYAPAGFTRGSVDCEMADFKTTLSMEDDLYSNMINPIKTFGVDGVKVWGNKTTYKTDSPLNRVNVRRLMIRVKKLVTSAARNLIFEQYSDTLEKQFRSLVEPILSEVKSNRGISDYRIVTEVTPETRDQHILPAKILIKPTPALEYISISFVVYPESVEFEGE